MRRLTIGLLIAGTLAFALSEGAPSATATRPNVPKEDCTIVIDSPEVWATFSPTDARAPFIGPPNWPIDVQGTWNVHDKIPGGHAGPDGTYSRGNPAKGGNWFYRQAEVSHEECPEPPPCPEDTHDEDGQCVPDEPPVECPEGTHDHGDGLCHHHEPPVKPPKGHHPPNHDVNKCQEDMACWVTRDDPIPTPAGPLPHTGSNVLYWFIAGLLLLSVGSGLYWLGREDAEK